MHEQITLLIKRMGKQPFSNLLGLQYHSFERHQFLNELALKEMDAFIRIAQEVERQEQCDEDTRQSPSIGEVPAIEEARESVSCASMEDHEMEESVSSPILEDDAPSQEDDIILWPVAGLLSRQLTELREHNRNLLATLNAEKDVNEHLLMQYQ
jgi:hypothetical protein